MDSGLPDRLKALAHPARLAILDVLAARGSCVCGEIVEVIPLAQSTVSEHLRIMKQAGIVRGTIDGPRSCYCLDAEALIELRTALDVLLDRLTEGARRCGAGGSPLAEPDAYRPPAQASPATVKESTS